MKKLVLFCMAIFFIAEIFAQSKELIEFSHRKIKAEPTVDQNNPIGDYDKVKIPVVKSVKDGDIEKISIGMSGNIWGSYNSLNSPISYHPDLGVLSYTFRADPVTHSEALASGTIMSNYSSDRGLNWMNPCYIVNTEAGNGEYNNRYPSGTIYNPSGNTSLDDAYFLVAGPSHDGANSVSWPWAYFGSSTLDCENNYYEFYETVSSNDMAAFMTGLGLITGDEKAMAFHMKTVAMLPDFFAASDIQVVNLVGDWVEDHFEFSAGIEIDFSNTLSIKTDDELNWRGAYTGGDGLGYAFSKDLSIGYVWLLGQAQSIMMGAQPIVFRSDDGGEDWDEIDIEFEDFEEEFEPWVFETWDGFLAPRFNQSVGTVDENGNLQIFAQVISSSTIHIDSVANWGYTFGGIPESGNVFNVEISEDGVEQVIWIDSLQTSVVEDDDDCAYGIGEDHTGWNNRLGIAKSPDESVLFFIWTDDHSGNDLNCSPDIFGNFRRVSETNLGVDSTVSFTEGTDFEGYNFYTYTGDYAFYDDDNYWNVPVSQTVSQLEFLLNTDLDPVTHSFVKGIRFYDDQVITGSDKIFAQQLLKVEQNSPNPTSGLTNINFSIAKNGQVHFICSNLLGQKVMEYSYRLFQAGDNRLQVDVANWEAGVYFYTLEFDNEKVTGKMLVE